MAVDRELTLSSPGAFARDLARQLGVAGFWGWWTGELATLVPAGPRAAWQRRRLRPVLAFDGRRATLWRAAVRDGRIAMVEDASIDLEGDSTAVAAAGRAALARGAAAQGGTPVTLALPPRAVLRKQLVLPLAVEENLRQVVGYDLDRHTPFKAEELYFDARVIERDVARNVVRVDLAAARRSIVDPLLRHAESWGATVNSVSAEPAQSAAMSPLNLLPSDLRNGRPPWKRWELWVPVAVLLAFALAATVLPLWQKREYAIALLQEADRARLQAAVSETLRAGLEREIGDYNFALERKFAFAPTVQILDDVSRLMPDDTWLTQLEVRSPRSKELTRELTLRGESANAGRLVSVLEESKLFTQAAPRSPTTKIQPGPGEIFDIGAQLKPLPAPAAAALIVADAKSAAPAATGAPPPVAAPPTAAPTVQPQPAAPATPAQPAQPAQPATTRPATGAPTPAAPAPAAPPPPAPAAPVAPPPPAPAASAPPVPPVPTPVSAPAAPATPPPAQQGYQIPGDPPTLQRGVPTPSGAVGPRKPRGAPEGQ